MIVVLNETANIQSVSLPRASQLSRDVPAEKRDAVVVIVNALVGMVLYFP
jgi:hypothetical protein